MGQDGKGLLGLARVNRYMVSEVLKRESRKEYTMDADATVVEAEKEEAKWSYK